MKSIKCELCGSNDLKKIDGEFVCQYCGAKYTIEEAKKMMVEIEGKVKIDSSSQVSNLESLAKRALNDGSFNKANEYYGKLLELDSDNWEYIYNKGLCEAKLGDLTAIVKGCKNAFIEMNKKQIKIDNPSLMYRKMANDMNYLAYYSSQTALGGLNLNNATKDSIPRSWNKLIDCVDIENYAASLIKKNIDNSEEDKNLYLAICKNIVYFCNELGKQRKYIVSRNQNGPVFASLSVPINIRNKHINICNTFTHELMKYDAHFAESQNSSGKSSGLSGGAIVAIICVVLGIIFCGMGGILVSQPSASTSPTYNSSRTINN